MMNKLYYFGLLVFIFSCSKSEAPVNEEAQLQFAFQFDATQDRLDNLGRPAGIAAGNAALSPDFSAMSTHFIELVPNDRTPYGGGEFIYKGAEVPASNSNPYGFSTAIDFSQAIIADEGSNFLEVSLKDIAPGTYELIRISLSFQKYDVTYNLNNIPVVGNLSNQKGTIASFVGFNNFIENLEVHNQALEVNEAKLQGFWAFETQFEAPYTDYNQIVQGQAPQNATTVVNPFPNAPIPPGSCVVSGSFNEPLIITGNEMEDLKVTLSLSTNKSFEWNDLNGNGQWDLDAQNPNASEPVIDMGLRGLKAFVN